MIYIEKEVELAKGWRLFGSAAALCAECVYFKPNGEFLLRQLRIHEEFLYVLVFMASSNTYIAVAFTYDTQNS